ncbi:hypothetical protein EYF80_020691 [Liparis tanakae]|uniref:Uncharacterized protein n=1 Tax=Liparis tanakae TaxID=230148 RepID=A0A4Z2HTM6_9TELE|nr:hypothetical protein EYF80_020691 [Liparis tanakae]
MSPLQQCASAAVERGRACATQSGMRIPPLDRTRPRELPVRWKHREEATSDRFLRFVETVKATLEFTWRPARWAASGLTNEAMSDTEPVQRGLQDQKASR